MDTTVLKIESHEYVVMDTTKFNPTLPPLLTQNRVEYQRFMETFGGYRKFIQNAPSSYREEGIIYPNLSIHERLRKGEYSRNLHIAISVPKLLFGHSYKEPTNADKDKVIDVLGNRLKDMSVEISRENLRYSLVQTLHYAKNILFPSLEDANIFLERMSKCSMGKWFENNVKTYSYDGRSVRFHTSIFEINFYLKYADVLQKGSRSVDRNKTLQEIQIAKEYQKLGKIPPVVRMEIRFIGARSITSHMKEAIGKDRRHWMFNEVFDTELSRKVLKFYWEKIIKDKLNYFLLCRATDADVCLKIQDMLKDEKSKMVAEALGLYFQLKSLGVKGLKEDIMMRHSYPTYQRKINMLVEFMEKFIKPDDTLIKIVSTALDGKPLVDSEDVSEQMKLSMD